MCAERSSMFLRLIWQVVHQKVGMTVGERYWGLADNASKPLTNANSSYECILTWM